jgi:hypothetical protein
VDGVDQAYVAAFEDQLDPANPSAGEIPAQVIGYGEISTVLQIGDIEGVVFKRLVGFRDQQAVQAHRKLVDAYCAKLRDAGISVVDTEFVEVENRHGEHVLYLTQLRCPPGSVGNAYLARAADAEFETALRAILGAIATVWTRNQARVGEEQLGVDCQASNWVLAPDDSGAIRPQCFDVGTPFVRQRGRELLDVEVILESTPWPLDWILRTFFMREVLDRYYDLHSVLTDLVGNFQKEGFPEKIPLAVEIVNRFFAEHASHLELEPLRCDDVSAYYKRDAFLWTVFLAFRRLARFVTTKIFRRRYPFILPGKIRR